jgi:hypothetical protein
VARFRAGPDGPGNARCHRGGDERSRDDGNDPGRLRLEVRFHRAGSEKQFRRAVAKLELEPIASAVFGGVVDPRKHFPFNHMEAVDVRDWAEIRMWAAQIAQRFLSLPVAV